MRKPDPLLVSRSADRFSALGAEPRLRIVRLLLSAHPTGMVAGEVQEKLKQAGLVNVAGSEHFSGIRQIPIRCARY